MPLFTGTLNNGRTKTVTRHAHPPVALTATVDTHDCGIEIQAYQLTDGRIRFEIHRTGGTRAPEQTVPLADLHYDPPTRAIKWESYKDGS